MRGIVRLFACSAFLLALLRSEAGVVINEILYHPPDDLPLLQWVELYNSDAKEVDLSGWRLSGGIQFKFPAQASIGPNGFLVICQDEKHFREYYDVPVAGEFKQALKHSGEKIELRDNTGVRVDHVRFSNRTPWPVAANGYSASLERISPSAGGALPSNWAASPMPEDEAKPAGSPGRRNDVYSERLPPRIVAVTVTPQFPAPGEPIVIEASLESTEALGSVEVRYQTVGSGKLGEESAVAMEPSGNNHYAARIPGQENGSLLRIGVRAVDAKGAERSFPAVTDLRPALSLYVQSPSERGTISLAHVINTDPRDVADAARYIQRARSVPDDGPFRGGRRWEALRMIEMGSDLETPWVELTLNQSPDRDTYRALRTVFIARSVERQQLIDEWLSSSDFSRLIQELPPRLAALQRGLLADVQNALPSEQRPGFARWYAALNKTDQAGPDSLAKRLLKIEGGWLALNKRFELTDHQRTALRPVYKKALEGRSFRNPALQGVQPGPGGFGAIQKVFGAVERQMWTDQRQVLTSPQWRYLEQWYRDYGAFVRPRLTEVRPLPPRGKSAFVVVDQQTGKPEVFDFVNITERSAGYKVRFHKDHSFRGMRTVDVIFETNDRFVLAEPLAYELYRRVGCPAPACDFVRLSLDGQTIGYHLLFEQINRSFLRRQQRNPNGDLYKLIWYGCSIEAQHEKQNHLETGHADLVRLIDRLSETSGQAQWQLIEKNFNVDEVINYFAVNMCLSHWDGFFNNYFAYHDRKGTGKWEIYAWDQDKTWGYYDAIKPGEVFYNMPITFGMAGDRPPGGGPTRLDPSSWWRPGGFFSKPLLANPEFRKRFLQRTRDILETHFTPGVMFPVFDSMAARIRPEIPIRAAAVHQDPAAALKRLEENIASFKENLTKRREFLLNESELKSVASSSR